MHGARREPAVPWVLRGVIQLVLALAFASSGGGCSSARMAGGKPVIPGDEPDGEQLGIWRTEDCRDAKGALAIDPGARVRVVRTSEQKLVLVDSRAGFDTVVSENGERRGAEWVYDIALKKSHGDPYLRQYRLPAKFDAAGRYLLTSAFEDWEAGDAFHARVTAPTVECKLTPAGL
jgi:hypothetical protein